MVPSYFQSAALSTSLPAVSGSSVQKLHTQAAAESRWQNTWCEATARAGRGAGKPCNPSDASATRRCRQFQCPPGLWSTADKPFSRCPRRHKNRMSQKRSDRFP